MNRPVALDKRREAAGLRQLPPRGKGTPGDGFEEHLVSLLAPHSFEADQYRLLRHFLDQTRAATGMKVLVVTSPAAGEGKTTTAINLAATLAQSKVGSRVLLVDTDLRQPLVAAYLGLGSGGPGLVGAVHDERLALESVVRITAHNLAVLPAGSPPPNPYEVLESARLGQLLEQARSAYDYIVVDTPPILLVPDCRLMSQWADHFLLVVAARRTTRKLLGDALSSMDPAKLLGIVFNGDSRTLSRYYERYYSNYHNDRSMDAGRRGWRSWLRRGPATRQRWR